MRSGEASDQAGFLSVPLGLGVAILVAAALGLFGLLQSWRRQMETQLRIDRCVGEKALVLKARMNAVEGANSRIQVIRASILVASLAAPETVEELKGLLTAQILLQNLELERWQFEQARWIVLRGCGSGGDLPIPLPSHHWRRPPPDALGDQPLVWEEEAPKQMTLGLYHLPRKTAAVVEASEEEHGSKEEKWMARWAIPH